MNKLKWMNWHWMNWHEWMFNMLIRNQALAIYSLVHLSPTSSSKSVPTLTVFRHFSVKSNSCLSPVHFFSTTFPDRGAKPQKQTLLRRPRKPLCPKKHRASRPKVFSSRNSRGPELMLMWLTWWCGYVVVDMIDVVAMMVRKLAMTIDLNSEVSELNFLWSSLSIINPSPIDLPCFPGGPYPWW